MNRYLLITAWLWVFTLFWVSASFALFFDFENPEQLEQWEAFKNVNAQWDILEGALKFSHDNMLNGEKINIFAIKDFEFTDGTIQYKLKWVEGWNCEICVFYRLDKLAEFTGYIMFISAKDNPPGLTWGYSDVDSMSPVIERVVVRNWGKNPVHRWFEFKIEVKGNQHIVYAGPVGQLEKVVEMTGEKREKGMVGLTNVSPSPETVLIDDFRVTSTLSTHDKLAITWGEIKRN